MHSICTYRTKTDTQNLFCIHDSEKLQIALAIFFLFFLLPLFFVP